MQLCSKPQVYFSSSPPLPQTAEAVGRILLFSPMYPAGSNIYPLFALSDKWGGNCIHTQKNSRPENVSDCEHKIWFLRNQFYELFRCTVFFIRMKSVVFSLCILRRIYAPNCISSSIMQTLPWCHFSFLGGGRIKQALTPLPACVWWMG